MLTSLNQTQHIDVQSRTSFRVSANSLLVTLLALHFLLALYYAMILPVHESYDEPAHYAYVRFVATTGRLPQPGEIGRDGEESHQPPLYYWLAAPSLKFIDVSDNLFADFLWGPYRAMKPDPKINAWWLGGTALAIRSARTASALMSTICVWFTFLTLRVALPKSKRPALMAAGLHSVWPLVTWMGGVVSNDNAIAFCGSLVLLLGVCLIKQLGLEKSHSRNVIVWSTLLGVAVFAALLSKDSAIAIVGYSTSLLAVRILYPRYNRRQALLALVTFSLSLLILIPIASSVSQGRSDRQFLQAKVWLDDIKAKLISKANSTPDLASITAFEPEATQRSFSASPQIKLTTITNLTWNLFQSLVGVYGRASLPLPDSWYYICALPILLAMTGSYFLIKQQRYRSVAANVVLLIFWVALAPLIRSIVASDFGMLTSRFLLPAYSAFCVLLALCTESLPQIARKSSQVLLLSALGSVGLYAPTVVIEPIFSKPPIFVALYNNNPLPNPSSIIYGDTIELLGYYSPSPRAIRAGSINLFVYWRLLKPTTRNYNLRIEVFSRNSASLELVREAAPAMGSFPTSQWKLGELYGEGFFLPVWEKTPAPTVAVFRLTWIDAETRVPLTAMCIGQPCESRLGQVPIELDTPTARRLSVENPPVAHFAGIGTLLRASIKQPIQRAKAAQIDLIWLANQDHIRPHKVFLHIIDAHKNLVSQLDFEPRHGDYPVEFWRKNEVIPDFTEVSLPASIPDGDYTINLGFYDADTLTRPTVSDATGKLLPNGEFPIAHIHLP